MKERKHYYLVCKEDVDVLMLQTSFELFELINVLYDRAIFKGMTEEELEKIRGIKDRADKSFGIFEDRFKKIAKVI